MPKKKDKIPPPGNKKDPYTNFMKKSKWVTALRQGTLDISGRNVQKEGARIVAHALTKNVFVTILNLTQNHVGDAGISEFVQMLKVNATIRTLNVSINDLSDVGGMMLASAFRDNITVTSLTACRNNFGDDTAVAFAHVLKINKEIKYLDLSWNAIGAKGTQALAKVMEVNRDFVINIFQNRMMDDGAAALARAYKLHSRPELHGHINWWQNDIGKQGAIGIAEMLEANTVLVSLNLSWNSVGSDGGEAIAKALGVNLPSPENPVPQKPFAILTHINLSQNIIGDLAAIAFGKLLQRNPPLLNLNLSHNNITSEGGTAIAEGMKLNNILTHLNLSHNSISDPSAAHFAEVVSTTSTLQVLWLQRNEMKDEGKNLISNAIPKNTKMRINYGAMDDANRYSNVLIQIKESTEAAMRKSLRRPSNRRLSAASAISSVTDSSQKRMQRSGSRGGGKPASRSSVVSDSTGSQER